MKLFLKAEILMTLMMILISLIVILFQD